MAETKERMVKPVASAKITKALFKGKGVTGMSISITSEGLINYDETENGFKALYAAFIAGEPVKVECFERESDTKPYMSGMFVITSLERTDPAGDDSTYSITLENDGAPDVLDESAITEGGDE